VRPDDNEDVAANGEKEEATHPGGVFGIDHVSKDLDQIKDQADDGQNDPGHQQARFSLPGPMDKKRGNDKIANADNEEDCHQCCRKGKERGSRVTVLNCEVEIAETPIGGRSSESRPSQANSSSQAAAKSSKQAEDPDKEDSCFQLTAAEELVNGWQLKSHPLSLL